MMDTNQQESMHLPSTQNMRDPALSSSNTTSSSSNTTKTHHNDKTSSSASSSLESDSKLLSSLVESDGVPVPNDMHTSKASSSAPVHRNPLSPSPSKQLSPPPASSSSPPLPTHAKPLLLNDHQHKPSHNNDEHEAAEGDADPDACAVHSSSPEKDEDNTFPLEDSSPDGSAVTPSDDVPQQNTPNSPSSPTTSPPETAPDRDTLQQSTTSATQNNDSSTHKRNNTNSTVQKMTKMWINREKRNTIIRPNLPMPSLAVDPPASVGAHSRLTSSLRQDTTSVSTPPIDDSNVDLPFPTPRQFRQSTPQERALTENVFLQKSSASRDETQNIKIIIPSSSEKTLKKTKNSSSFFGRRKPRASSKPSISPKSVKSNSPSHTSYPIIHSGYLTKEGAVFHSWKRRFFILRENKVLYYHSNPKTPQFKGQILLQNTLIKKIESKAYKGKENCFQIYSKEFSRTYYMFADSPQDMDIWIKKLRQVTYGVDESVLKWLILGQKGCGKSSLIRRWHTGVFDKNLAGTEGVEKTVCKTTTDEGNVIEIELHEASDASVDIEHLDEALTEDTSCVILMFDLTNRESWERLKAWIPILKTQLPERLFIILATKMDLRSQRRISTVVAQLFASKMNVDYMEATASSNAGDHSFGFIVESLVRRGKIVGE